MAETLRNLRATATLATALASVAFASGVSAQTVGEDYLEFGGQVDLRYDSNVINGNAQRAEARGFSRDDQVVTPSLTAAINKTFGRNAVRASALIGYDFHLQNPRLDSERISVDLLGLISLSVCELRPGINFQRRQAERGDRSLVIDPGIAIDNVQTIQEYKLDVACGRSIGLRPIGGVSFRSGDNSSDLRQLADFNTFTYYGGLGYQQPSIGTLDLYASKASTEYENRMIGDEFDGFDVFRAGAAYSRDIGARWNARIEGFYIDTNAVTAVEENYNGLGWNIGLNGTFPPRLSLGVQFGKDVQPVLNNDALYMKQTTYGVNADYAVNERWNIGAAYSLRDRNYVYSAALPPSTEGNLTEDQFNTATVSATYTTASPLSFTAYGGYENRSANNPIFDYDGFYAGLTVKYLFRR
ncbi:hypothetical protein E3U23_07870 [Erythrobacter litoralis]|uniref:hypothetical protein n=1 Tax=Erythrobacter litoralis TaxID=39960 RepID=UPI002435E4A1|nr:hypothetical protein [Erythrobacter litoralis]MDG6079107.1 hypothetical protein [Erythrobacter litoralis]